MSVIPQVYNQGTGLIGSATEGNTVPENVQNLVVDETLTVLGDTTLNGDVQCNSDVDIAGALSVNNIDVQQVTIDDVTIEQDLTVVGQIRALGSIGNSAATQFVLPTNFPASGQIIKTIDNFGNTEWQDDQVLTDYVEYSTALSRFLNQSGGVATNIDSATFGESTGANGGTLSVLNNGDGPNGFQAFEVTDNEFSFRTDYTGGLDVEPKLLVEALYDLNTPRMEFSIENTNFSRGIEIENDELVIRSTGDATIKLQLGSQYLSLAALPTPVVAGLQLQTTGSGNGSRATPYETEWV